MEELEYAIEHFPSLADRSPSASENVWTERACLARSVRRHVFQFLNPRQNECDKLSQGFQVEGQPQNVSDSPNEPPLPFAFRPMVRSRSPRSRRAEVHLFAIGNVGDREQIYETNSPGHDPRLYSAKPTSATADTHSSGLFCRPIFRVNTMGTQAIRKL